MSAIYGIINKDGRPVDPEQLQKMKQAMAHRAHDGSGEMICDNAAFGFCKLAVYPNQEHEQLPIRDGDLLFTANAHLHNRDELINKLGFDKLQYANTPDSYLILAAYKKWGEECVHYLDGEYVFVVWNKILQELYIITDHIGYKPVYYYDFPKCFIFCSEIKGIEAVKETPNIFDKESLIHYFFWRGDPVATYNKEIKLLPGASIVTLQRSQITKNKYWIPTKSKKYSFKKDEDWYECMRHVLKNAIECRLNTEIPIGISLSGGIDSSSIACILSEILRKKNKPLYAYSSVLSQKYNGKAKDEKKYIELLHKHCGNIEQTYIESGSFNLYTDIAKVFSIDEQVPNSFYFMDQAILKAAQKQKIGIIFSGMGGDYWLSAEGSPILYEWAKSLKISKVYNAARSISSIYEESIANIVKKHIIKQIPFIKEYLNRKKKFTLEHCFKSSFIGKRDLNLQLPSMMLRPDYWFGTNEEITQLMLHVFANRSEYYNITSAVPLLDKNLLEFLIEVPLQLFLKNGYKRSFIRHGMGEILPEEIRWRKTKSPYIPGVKTMILEEKNQVKSAICSNSYDLFFKYIFEKKVITELFEKTILAPENFYFPHKLISISQINISLKVLEDLKKRKYIFSEI